MLGAVLVLIFKGVVKSYLKLFLSFSGAYLLSITFLHLIPEVYETSTHNIGFYVLIGFIVQLILEFFSNGIEHGHMHAPTKGFPIMIMVSLCIHSLLEGLPLEREIHHELHEMHNHDNHSLLLGIITHKIPVAITLMTLLLNARISNIRSLLWMAIFAIMAPLGTFLGHVYGDELMALSHNFFDKILGVVIGMFLHISTTIIFESQEGHRFNLLKLVIMIFGASIAMI